MQAGSLPTGMIFSHINQTKKFHRNNHNNEILLKRPVPARRDKTSHITSPLESPQSVIACSKLTIETLVQGVKYVQS